MKTKLKDKDKREIFQAFGLMSHIGFTMAFCIIGCIFLGNFLDKVFETSPLFVLIFSILGITSAILSLFKITSNHWKK